MSTIRFMSMARTLQTVVPCQSIMCMVPSSTGNGTIGLSVSDPTIGYAIPVQRRNTSKDHTFWQYLIKTQKIGGILVAPNPGQAPACGVQLIQHTDRRAEDFRKFLLELEELHEVITASGIQAITKWENLSLDFKAVERECRTNDWWTFLAENVMANGKLSSSLDVNLQSSIMLQSFLFNTVEPGFGVKEI
mmetsp:Transcript_48814/g.71337  ORF Transcript_48814/g.71337 Transcript_48814/m.71337 type:complete len:191 (+) Transcript_48814:88-660(+)